jgi:hypothetical protein
MDVFVVCLSRIIFLGRGLGASSWMDWSVLVNGANTQAS